MANVPKYLDEIPGSSGDVTSVDVGSRRPSSVHASSNTAVGDRPPYLRRTAVAYLVIFTLSCSAAAMPAVRAQSPAPAAADAASAVPRFEKDIVAFEASDRIAPPPREGIVFVGSSIFRLWEALPAHMAPLPVFNRAFGGSRTDEQLLYVDRLVLPHRPRVVVYYCGSNDVNAGVTAERIAGNFQAFVGRVRAALPNARIVYVSVIKAPQKRDRWSTVDAANALVREYASRATGVRFVDVNPALQDAAGEPRLDLYLPDLLHYRPPAYDQMAAAIRPAVEAAWRESRTPVQ